MPDMTQGHDLAHLSADHREHALREHLVAVGELAFQAAERFGAGDWARLAGLWHDLGKYRAGFQKYIRQANDPDAHVEGKVGGRDKTHSAAGALWAMQYLPEIMGTSGSVVARVLGYVIAGHHAGLDNWTDGLNPRLSGEDAKREFADALNGQTPQDILRPDVSLPSLNALPIDGKDGRPPGAFALWVRMLFSALVDADFLDTEEFLDGQRSEARKGYPGLGELVLRFEEHMDAMRRRLRASAEAITPVNVLRASVLEQCREKAQRPPGVFTLTVPTGGGKTLSSLAFALEHAVRHGKRRIVYAIPYTSIIEQTADIFRDIFGDEYVVEHHSNVEAEATQETQRSRLACENWDAPLIVTTNVQLFESLFARRTSRCRKLHNLINSVIVLDEAQLLPVEFLQPILDVLVLLIKDYGVTLVLCTATQPALTARQSFDPRRGRRGFTADQVTEIVDDVPALYAALKRVRVHRPTTWEKREWSDIKADVERHPAALTIVNRRQDAADLYRLLRVEEPQGLFHLSGLMCAQHRSDVIARIKTALEQFRNGEISRIHVVSTQLVEAGVDLDFPVVFRAMAGLDSVAQAAGRCNREGRLAQGDVYVFVPPTLPPPGLLRQAEQECRTLWSELPSLADPIVVELYGKYFDRLYAQDLDRKRICETLKPEKGAVRFRDAAENFRLIDDKDSATVVVSYRGGSGPDVNALIGKLEAEGPQRWLMRKLQRYTVTLYKHDADRLLRSGDLRCVDQHPGLYVQASDVLYDLNLGLKTDSAPGDPKNFVI